MRTDRTTLFGIAIFAILAIMNDRGSLLKEVMTRTDTTQTQLSGWSGVHQPSISQFLTGRTPMSDEMLERLLSCMGFRLEVVRRAVEPVLTRSEHRSWILHRQLSTHLTQRALSEWSSRIKERLTHIRSGVTGQPHTRNVERWDRLVEGGHVSGLRRVLTGLDRDSIEMREVSPMGGLLSQEERLRVWPTP